MTIRYQRHLPGLQQPRRPPLRRHRRRQRGIRLPVPDLPGHLARPQPPRTAACHHSTVHRHRPARGEQRMTAPALALLPVLTDHRTGTGASTRTLDDELLDRAARDDYHHWLSTTMPAGGCARPIRLRGTIRDIDPATGEILSTLNTDRHAGQGDLPALRRPPRLGLPAPAPKPTGPTPTSSSAPGSPAARASPNPSPSTRACSPPSPPRRSAPSTPASSPTRRTRRPMPAPPQSLLLHARAADLLRTAAQGRRRLPRPTALPRLLRLQRRRRLERPRLRAMAPHRHHPAPPARQARQNPRRPGPAVLCQGRRIPAPRTDPLPRHLPARRHRPRPPRERTVQPHPAITADLLAGLIRQVAATVWFATVPHPAKTSRLGHQVGRPGRSPSRRSSPATARSPTSPSPPTWPSTPPKAPSPPASRPAASPPRTPASGPTSAPTRDASSAPASRSAPTRTRTTRHSGAGRTCSATAATSPPKAAATPPPCAHSAPPDATGNADSTRSPITTTTRPSSPRPTSNGPDEAGAPPATRSSPCPPQHEPASTGEWRAKNSALSD